MKVCYFGTFEKDYPRNITFIEGLKRSGVEVLICHGELKAEKGSLSRLSYLPVLLFKYLFAYIYLFLKALTIRCDAVIIGYPSHADVLIFYPLFSLKGIPLFFNPLVSLYDTFVLDRKLFKESSLYAKVLYFIDRLAFSLPKKVFIDTESHRDFLADTFKLKKEKFAIIPVGTLEVFFCAGEEKKNEGFQVLYCGKYIPLHSVETIVRAAKLLTYDREIWFKLIGKGQEYEKIRNLVMDEGIENIEFIEWLPPEEVAREIKRSHVVLGIFKREGKASRVIPNKVYDALACGACVVTGESPAIKELFQDGRELFLVEPENPKALAEKIAWIKANYHIAIEVAKKGFERVKEIADLTKIGESIKRELF